MHLAPIFTRRLAFMPLDLGHPVWVESDEVDLDHHIRKAPGGKLTVRQVEAAAARLHSVPVDRERPLWEFRIVENAAPPVEAVARRKPAPARRRLPPRKAAARTARKAA